jgi:hypothetical protein
MGTPGFPDIVGFYDMLYGTAGVDWQTLGGWPFSGASGLVFSGNPPFTVTDFLGTYPKFLGPATNFNGLVVTSGSPNISGFTSTNGISAGQLITDPAFPKDTFVLSVTQNAVVTTRSATAAGTTLTVYETPMMPVGVIAMFVTLAGACVMCARYHEMWPFMMSLFVAHYCTLYMRTETASPNETPSQVASSGLTKGILIHRAAGDVSATSQLIAGYEQWGAWTETQYGEQFITIGRAVNCGPVWVP